MPLFAFPPDWPQPSAIVQREIDAAAKDLNVPPEILYAVARKESSFNPKAKGYANAANNARFAKSYASYKDRVIPGINPKGLTWGDMFTAPESWTAYGLIMALPFNLVGKKGLVAPGEPIDKLFHPRFNVRGGAGLLHDHYTATGDWEQALRRYNNSSAYVREVLDYAKELGFGKQAPATVGEDEEPDGEMTPEELEACGLRAEDLEAEVIVGDEMNGYVRIKDDDDDGTVDLTDVARRG